MPLLDRIPHSVAAGVAAAVAGLFSIGAASAALVPSAPIDGTTVSGPAVDFTLSWSGAVGDTEGARCYGSQYIRFTRIPTLEAGVIPSRNVLRTAQLNELPGAEPGLFGVTESFYNIEAPTTYYWQAQSPTWASGPGGLYCGAHVVSRLYSFTIRPEAPATPAAASSPSPSTGSAASGSSPSCTREARGLAAAQAAVRRASARRARATSAQAKRSARRALKTAISQRGLAERKLKACRAP